MLQYLSNSDISFNTLNDSGLNIEYTIQTPSEAFTFSTETPTSMDELFRNFEYTYNNNTSERNTSTINTFNESESENESDNGDLLS
jgi:hypothetical protein